jgi:hypothetical protein
MISSIEYNKENEGIATNTKIIEGIKVQIISKNGACITISGFLLDSLLNKITVRINI